MPRRRLRPISVKLPTASAQVVPCQWVAPLEAELAAECLDWKPKSSKEFWSSSAVVGFDCSGSPRQTRPGGEVDCEYISERSGHSSECPCTFEDCPAVAEGPSRSIVLFLPDAEDTAQGRSFGSTFDAAATISTCPGVDWHRLSWPASSLPMDTDYAVEHVLESLQLAISKKSREASQCGGKPKHIQVFLIGHSFGGTVATQAACELTSVFKYLGLGPFCITIDGLCVIDAVPSEGEGQLELDLLQNARVMLIASQHVLAVDFQATRELFAAVPATRKEVLLLSGHGSSSHRHLPLRLADFVRRGHLGGRCLRPPP